MLILFFVWSELVAARDFSTKFDRRCTFRHHGYSQCIIQGNSESCTCYPTKINITPIGPPQGDFSGLTLLGVLAIVIVASYALRDDGSSSGKREGREADEV